MESGVAKKYFLRLISILCVLIVFSLSTTPFFYSSNFTATSNFFLFDHQLEKLEKQNSFETVIVGDSSAGNAIDASRWGSPSQTQTVNVALTGSFGLIGTYNMIRHAHQTQPRLKNVIIIHTLDLWRRPVDDRGFFETLRGLPPIDLELPSRTIHYSNALPYQFNPKEIYWYIKRKLFSEEKYPVLIHDYIEQNQEKFSQGNKFIVPSDALSEVINTEQVAVYYQINQLCKDLNLSCWYAHGPLHEIVHEQSQHVIEKINEELRQAKNIHIDTEAVFFPSEKMGDAIDHIDPNSKTEVSNIYYVKWSKR